MLELSHVTRRFGPTVAVDDVSLTIGEGEVVGLVGENGAGKSTLMRVVAGELLPDAAARLNRPPSIGFVHQHFALVPHFTIAENLALAHEQGYAVRTKHARENSARDIIARSGIDLAGVSRIAGELSVGEKSKLELIKAIAADPQLLILDEPTSVLTPLESEELFKVIRKLAGGGTAVVFISHKVPEVLAIAQRIVVMRRGRIVADQGAAGMTAIGIAEAMVEPSDRRMTSRKSIVRKPDADAILRLDTLSVHSGEIVAIVGVAGNGQAELMTALRQSHTGAFIPEDRSRDALVAQMSVAENIALGARRWNRRAAEARAAELVERFGIRTRNVRQLAGELSGGNQQKVVLARELGRDPQLIVAAEPTRGLDVEATRFVHEQLREAVAGGAGVLLITSDLDEAFDLADKVHVIYRGRLSDPMTPAVASQNVARLMAGVT